MEYDIFIADIDRKTVLQLPILPEEMPSLQRSSKSEDFETFSNGTYNLIDDVGLMKFNLDTWLPGKGKNYSFQRIQNINPDEYIQLVDMAMLYKNPLRVIMLRSDGTYIVNDTFSVENFEWHEDKVGDYVYKIDFKQWRDYNV